MRFAYEASPSASIAAFLFYGLRAPLLMLMNLYVLIYAIRLSPAV